MSKESFLGRLNNRYYSFAVEMKLNSLKCCYRSQESEDKVLTDKRGFI
jgi:hypothetical protein